MAERVPTRPVQRLLGWLVAPVLAVHLLALYLPAASLGPAGPPGLDKVVHVFLFAVPVWLLGRLSGRIGLVAGLFTLHAVVSELVQARFVPGRAGEVGDLLADLAGTAVAAGWLLLARRGA